MLLNQQSPHQKHQRSISAPQGSTSRSTYPSSTVQQEPPGILNDDLSFSESFHYYSNSLPPITSMDLLFESETPAHDVNFETGGNEGSKQQQRSELCSKLAHLDPALKTSAFTNCGCVQSALSILSSLYGIVHGSSASSLDSILAVARNGLFTCETLTLARCSSCQSGSSSILLLLCVGILQQVHNAYELVGNPAKLSVECGDRNGKKMAFSIKIGDMEIADIGHSPSIIHAILKMEKARAERVCVELEKMATDAQHGDLPGVGKEETMVRDGLIGLLGVIRGQFTIETM